METPKQPTLEQIFTGMRKAMGTIPWIPKPTRYMFFTGKGGVGKTSLACATAVALADQGQRVLLISTDPASNVQHVFQTDIGENAPTPISSVPRLSAINIRPQAAAEAYRRRAIAPMRGILPEEAIKSMLEELSGSCTTEIAAFDQFTGLLADPATARNFDHIIFDTAPTGHSLLLLDATGSYHRDVMRNLTGKAQMRVNTALMKLQNPNYTRTVLVTLPETTPILEASELQEDLQRAGIHPLAWVINSSLLAARPADGLLAARANAEFDKLKMVAQRTERVIVIPWLANEPVGLEGLRQLCVTGNPASPAKKYAGVQ